MSLRAWPSSAPSVVPSGRFRRSPHVLAARQGDEVALLDPGAGQYYTLNDVGSRVWALLADPMTLPQIVEVIRREYVMSAETEADPVERDIARFLRDLHRAGLMIAETDRQWPEVAGAPERRAEGAKHES